MVDFDDMVERAAQARLRQIQETDRRAGISEAEIADRVRWLPTARRDIAATLRDAGVPDLLDRLRTAEPMAALATDLADLPARLRAVEQQRDAYRRSLLHIAQTCDGYAASLAHGALSRETTDA